MIAKQQYLGMERNSFGFIFLLFTILVSGELVCTQARMCYSRSRNFRGFCIINHNCASVCMSEGFTFGYCTRWRHLCMCYKPCGGPPEFSPPFGETPPWFRPLEGMLLASQATSKSSRPSEVEVEAPSLGPSPSEEMSPGESPGPSLSEDISLGEVEGPSLGPSFSEDMSLGEVEAPAPGPSPTERIVVSPRTPPFSPGGMSLGEPDPKETLSLQFEEPDKEMPSLRRNDAASRPFSFNFDNIN